ncbi:glycerophosphoinositol inositolphosphodiesterase GDPD2 isoform X2 [Myripristis murdjan]|uniref:glycerophosphoinositol inositolphosphodiesterase GDPD2 isoform X2 n=1 Tax=Myripristis murdjan TaxID=586833 RepID=UPI0011761CEE|nr:glycerophosphoinositol inositolphosphodiesterase GDPD2 isoform X2 [Myripristis murdjan]
MTSHDSCCRICCRGFYSCNWRQPVERKRRHACCWFSVVTLVCLLMLCWMYICLVTFNDREDVNWKAFTILKRWVNWFMVVIIISALLTSYCILLLLFALFQVVLRVPLDLHWVHKIFLILGVIFVVLGIAGISIQWQKEWPTVLLSLQATAPFLQLGAVGALTLLSWFVFCGFHKARSAGSKILIAVVFAVVSAAIFLCPCFIHSPCLIELNELPPKPNLIGHRGAPMLAPENTMMSFTRSVRCNVTAFETDVQLSQDNVPFLMHDNASGFLLRTTDVKKKFPTRTFNHSSNLTWEKLQSLNAGDWFLQTDPFHSVSQLSAEERETAKKQTIPSLRELLDLAQKHNISVIFDLKNNEYMDTVRTVETIQESGIAPGLILWLPPANREYVMEKAPGFIQVYANISAMKEEGGNHLNLKYSALTSATIRELRSTNVSVNLWVVNERWLFSLLWCSGANSVTTNSCHLLQDMNQPDWTLAPRNYKIIWITVDLVSILVMCGLFILQRKRYRLNHTEGAEKPYPAWNQIDMSPFLSSE